MTGWRLGWMVLPQDLVRSVECLAQNLFISPPALSQYVGLFALQHRPYFENLVHEYAECRRILLNELPKAGITAFAPADGAFYLYADVSEHTTDSLTFCRNLLRDTGVACTPGVDFDPAEGNKFIRFSFCTAPKDVLSAVKALQRWL